jgi:hypothetical protein
MKTGRATPSNFEVAYLKLSIRINHVMVTEREQESRVLNPFHNPIEF